MVSIKWEHMSYETPNRHLRGLFDFTWHAFSKFTIASTQNNSIIVDISLLPCIDPLLMTLKPWFASYSFVAYLFDEYSFYLAQRQFIDVKEGT